MHAHRSLALAACLLAAASPSARAACSTAPGGHVAWWTADHGFSDIVSDLPTTAANGASITNGFVGNSFLFDGEDDHLFVGDAQDLDPYYGLTVDFILYQAPPDYALRFLLAKGSENSGYAFTIEPSTQFPGYSLVTFYCHVTSPASGWRATGAYVPNFAWSHVTGTFDSGTGTARIYVNGAEQNSFSLGPGFLTQALGYPFVIGGVIYDSVIYYPFDGALDEVQVFDRALSAQEVATLNNSGSADGVCRPPARTCLNTGILNVCASFPQTPDGTGAYIATGDATFGAGSFRQFGVRDGEIKIIPAANSLSFRGTLYARTPFGNIPLFTKHGLTRFNLPTNGTPWTPGEGIAELERMLHGVPGIAPDLGLDLTSLPFESLPGGGGNFAGLSLDFDSGKVSGHPSFDFGVPGFPGTIQTSGSFELTANPLGVTGNVGSFTANIAGVEVNVQGASIFMGQNGWDTGLWADRARVRIPAWDGGLGADFQGFYASPGAFWVRNGELELPPLDLGAFKMGGAHAELSYLDPGRGYKLCADGSFSFPQANVGVGVKLGMVNGQVRQGCLTSKVGAIPILPPFPVYLTEIGGCFEGTPGAYDEVCYSAAGSTFPSGCLLGRCDLGYPSFALDLALAAGPPSPLGSGYLVSADPVVLGFGPLGFRASATVSLLNQQVGVGEICTNSWGAEMCANVEYLHFNGVPAVTGSARLVIDSRGLSGEFQGCFDPPYMKLCALWGFCREFDPSGFQARVTAGDFEVSTGLFSSERREGFTAGIGFCNGCNGSFADCWPGSGVFGVDIRSGQVFFAGVKALPRQLGANEGPVVPGAAVSQSSVVPEGLPQVMFMAKSDLGAPSIVAHSPSGFDWDASNATELKDEGTKTTFLTVLGPEAGTWTMDATGPEGSVVETAIGIEPQPATVSFVEPVADTTSRHVEWFATIPASAEPTTLKLVATPDDELRAVGAGLTLLERPLVAGGDFYEIPDGALPAGTWGIVAWLDDGIGHRSQVAATGHVVIEDTTPPDPPLNPTLAPLPDGLRASWQASPSVDVARYEVLVEDPANPGAQVVLPAGAGLSLDLENMPDEARRVLVRAIDTSGNVGNAVEAGTGQPNASADGTPPAAPTGLALQALGTTGVRVTWNGVGDAASYRVAYGITAAMGGAQASQGASPVMAAGTTLDLTGLVPGMRVFASVAAVDAALNESAFSEPADLLLTSGADSDGDTLPDDWEKLWFGSLAHGAGEDADGDHLSIEDELELGFDALVKNDYAWGDLAPVGGPDGVVDVTDVVRGLLLAVAEITPSPDERRRGDVAPADVTPGTPDVATPRREAPRVISVSDLVLILRAAVGLASFPDPVP